MRGCYVQENKTSRTPGSYIAFDTETSPWATGTPGKTANSLYCLCGVYWRREKQRVRCRREIETDSCNDWWAWVRSRLSKHRATWIFAHNISFDLTVSRFWDIWDAGDYVTQWHCLDDPPVILKGHLYGNPVVFVDTYNWFRSSLKDIGEQFGLPKLEMPDVMAPYKEWIQYCWRDVEIVEKMVNSLVDLVKQLDLGVMRTTIPTQAFRHWRHTSDRPKVLIPNSELETEIARAGYVGGRAECFYVGKVKGPVYVLDVNSMYAHIMAETMLPCRLLDVADKLSLVDLNRLSGQGSVAATVKLSTDYPYPYRHNGVGTIWATGEFWSTLVGEELDLAIKAGHVTAVTRAANYQLAPVCQSFAKFWLKQREEYRAAGNRIMESIAKSMPNSLYGKWGQTASEWTEFVGYRGRERFTSFNYYDKTDGLYYPCRVIAGHAEYDKSRGMVRRAGSGCNEELMLHSSYKKKETDHSFPAIAAWITSAARLHMDRLREACKPGKVYYQCYDCLHVDEEAYLALQDCGFVYERQPGKLKLKGKHNEIEYYGLNCLRIDGKLKAAGLSRIHRTEDSGDIRHTTFERLSQILSRRPDGTVFITESDWSYGSKYKHGAMHDSGWTSPIVIRE